MTLWQEYMPKRLLKQFSDNVKHLLSRTRFRRCFACTETACPMENFVKLVKNKLKLFLYGCRYAIFPKKLGRAESPVIPTVFGLSKTLVVLWRLWHLRLILMPHCFTTAVSKNGFMKNFFMDTASLPKTALKPIWIVLGLHIEQQDTPPSYKNVQRRGILLQLS